MKINEKQMDLFHWFAGVQFTVGEELTTVLYETRVHYPQFFWLDTDRKLTRLHTLQEELTASLQHKLGRPIIVVKYKESYFVLFNEQDDYFGLQLRSENGYEFECALGKYHQKNFFIPADEGPEQKMLTSYLEVVQRLLAEQPAYRMHDATGTLIFKGI